MPLNVIYGVSKTNKTKRLFEFVVKNMSNDKTCVVFTPNYAKIREEKEYMECTNSSGIAKVKITSLDRYIEQQLDINTICREKTYLTDNAYSLVVADLLETHKNEVKMFEKVKNKPGYTDMLCDMVKRMDLEQIDIEKTKKMFANKTDLLSCKFNEFLNIYQVIKKEMMERYVSRLNLYDIYIEKLKTDTYSQQLVIFFDGYNNFNNYEYSIIQTYLSKGINVYVTLTIDDVYESNIDIFNISQNTLSKLKKLTRDITYIKCVKEKSEKIPEDIQLLQENIYISRNAKETVAGNSICMKICVNPCEEVKFIAQDILKNIRMGMRYKDIAVVTNDIESYEIYLKKIFGHYEIPIYIDNKMKLSKVSIATYLITILKLVNNGFTPNTSTYIIESLKTGLWPISYEQGCNLYNYIQEFGIKGYEFIHEFRKNNKTETKKIYDLDELNNIRSKICIQIQTLSDNLKKCTNTEEYTHCIYNHLTQYSVISRFGEFLQSVEDVDVEKYKLKLQAITSIYNILDDICLAFDKITLDRYIYLLEMGIKQSEISTIPSMLDQVEVGDINKSNGMSKKYVYIVGVYDGGLPKLQGEDNIFSDNELFYLSQLGIELKQDSVTRLVMERYNIYQCINRVLEKLILTMPQSSMMGTTYAKSQLFNDIKKIVDVPLDSITDITQNGIDDFLKQVSQQEINQQEAEKLYNEYCWYKPKYEQLFDYVQREDNLSNETLTKVYKSREILSSVSRMEQFQQCPFSFCINYILKLKPAEKYEISSIDMGSIMHAILEAFSRKILAEGSRYKDIIQEEYLPKIKMWVEDIVEMVLKEYNLKYQDTAKFVYQKNKLKKSMFRIIMQIGESFAHSEFNELGSEIVFDKNGVYAPIEINLAAGKKLLLRGKIDRIDQALVNNKIYMRIVDYKSSAKQLSLKDIEEGVSLQLMTYMMAIMQNYAKEDMKVFPAAIGYITLNSQTLNLTEYLGDETCVKQKLIKNLKLNGIYVSDVNVLNSMDTMYENSKESYIDVSPQTRDTTRKTITNDEFLWECENIKRVLKNIGEEIVQGKTSIKGYMMKDETCKFCAYKSICKKCIV